MGKKRKLDASIPPDLDASNLPDDLEAKAIGGGSIGGFWGNSAINLLKNKLEETQASISAAITQGVVAIDIDPEQIRDEAGTDRLVDWQDDDDFKALVADMKRRGQKQPVRVRPADSDWAPDADDPYRGQGAFIIQSGRRRLAAAKALGIPVKAVISTDEGDATLADLEERFLENTMRKDLSGFEQLMSIGMLARRYQDMSQSEIAERLQVPQGDVSLGLSSVEFYDQIVALVDIENTPKRAFREIIPKIKRGELGQGAPKSASAKKSSTVYHANHGPIQIDAKPSKSGLAVTIRGFDGGAIELQNWLEEVAKSLSKREQER